MARVQTGKKGIIRPEDVPYMQRGGSPDNTDVKGAKNKLKWAKSDKDYASGGFKKEQSVYIFGYGDGIDWLARRLGIRGHKVRLQPRSEDEVQEGLQGSLSRQRRQAAQEEALRHLLNQCE